MSTYIISSDRELYHYGVIGMKWGVRRAASKARSNAKLEKKAYVYDKRSANLAKKSEKRHAEYDLERSNRAAVKSAKYAKKAANLYKKSLTATSEGKRLRQEQKAANLEYRAASEKMKANRVSKTTGYGIKAMKYSIKSDEVAVKAAKARAKIASNKAYINMMDRKMSSLSKEQIRKVETPISEMMRDSISSAVSSIRDKTE